MHTPIGSEAVFFSVPDLPLEAEALLCVYYNEVLHTEVGSLQRFTPAELRSDKGMWHFTLAGLTVQGVMRFPKDKWETWMDICLKRCGGLEEHEKYTFLGDCSQFIYYLLRHQR